MTKTDIKMVKKVFNLLRDKMKSNPKAAEEWNKKISDAENMLQCMKILEKLDEQVPQLSCSNASIISPPLISSIIQDK